MPADDRLGLDEHQDIGPSGPEPAERHPEPSVDGDDARPTSAWGEHGKLLPKGEVLEREVGVRSES